MEYIVAAWHSQLIDWAQNIPKIETYDATNNMKILRRSKRKIGLILTDYQPQLTTKLNKIDFYPDQVFSVYDYLQDVHDSLNNQILDYQDLVWPEDAIFDITPYRILVISQGRLYAKIIFDSKGKLLSINYYDDEKKLIRKLLIDSRGFISSEETDTQIIYFDPVGHWRFKYNKQTDEVRLNSVFNNTWQHEYTHLRDLINEVLIQHFLMRIKTNDNLIVTLDDKSMVSARVYEPYNSIFVLNKEYPYEKSIAQITRGRIVVSSKQDADEVQEKVYDAVPITIIPSFPIQPSFGHSQRLKRQIIALFTEKTSYEELRKITELIYQRLINNPDGEGLYFLSYSEKQSQIADQVIKDLQQEHKDEFDLQQNHKNKDIEDENIDKLVEKPELLIKSIRITSIAETMNLFDKVRILINWNSADKFMMTTAIGVGIPQLQNFSSTMLINNENGKVCENYTDLADGLSYYLDDLQNWNQALVYDVRLLNKYSEDNLIKKWNYVLSGEI